VHPLEAAISQPRRATLDVIQRAFEAAGVEFTDGDQPGVRLTAAAARQLIAAHKDNPTLRKNGDHQNAAKNDSISRRTASFTIGAPPFA
jgi:hypothetical protein